MTQHIQDTHPSVVATLAGRVIDIRLLEQKAQAELHRAIREMADLGMPVDDLSAASGLSTDDIRRILERDLALV